MVEILAKEHAHALLARSHIEGEVSEHTMSDLDLGEPKAPKVEAENTNGLVKVPEETDPQDLREEAQGLTSIIKMEMEKLVVTQAVKVLEVTQAVKVLEMSGPEVEGKTAPTPKIHELEELEELEATQAAKVL